MHPNPLSPFKAISNRRFAILLPIIIHTSPTRTRYVKTPSQLRTMMMASMISTGRLNTGASIPMIGFGTWQDAASQEEAVSEALRAGYRHIDTAYVYRTEAPVGRAIKKSGIPRSDLFITTKLWNNSHRPSDVAPALDASLRSLDLDYVDLYLMHWPGAFASGESVFPKDENGRVKVVREATADEEEKNGEGGGYDFVDTYRAMEELFRGGKARAIGVSNFSRAEVERVLAETRVVPAVHQYECHPWLQQRGFGEWLVGKGIHVTQYSPFGNQNETHVAGRGMGKMIEDPVLVKIGKKHGKTGAQVALAWGIAHGHSVIPKSKTPSRIRANLEGDFKLSPDEVEEIDSLDKKLRLCDPSEEWGFNFFSDLDGKSKKG